MLVAGPQLAQPIEDSGKDATAFETLWQLQLTQAQLTQLQPGLLQPIARAGAA